MYILGVWDGHDCGAAIVKGNKILVAINEERISKKKLHVGMPVLSIKACLDYCNLKPSDIQVIATTTCDIAKTLTRVFPSMKDKYYLFRRRKADMPRFVDLKRNLKYRLTEFGSNFFTRKISEVFMRKELNKLGFSDYNLFFVDHHLSHAATAAYCSGMNKALVISIDGVGDGLSATVNIFKNKEIKRIKDISSRNSLGIFFEQVTNLLNFRELEDEGKVMAMADFSFEIPEKDNKLMHMYKADGLDIKSRYSVSKRYMLLKKALWGLPSVEFAYMAQKTLEKNMVDFFRNVVEFTGIKNVCWAGGVASNIKANMRIKEFCNDFFVFPHMGDGGLALGAAMQVNNELNNVSSYEFNDAYLGTEYSDEEIEDALKQQKLNYHYDENVHDTVGDLISKDNYCLWFQGRMEFGPRALGNRSILASATSEKIKDKLNIDIKRRDYFQPFCPSLLEEERKRFFVDGEKPDRFMTMGYQTSEKAAELLKSVINVDGSARPQMIGTENPKFRQVISRVKKNTGYGIVLNTSFNLHGYPIVMTPEDAINMMKKTKTRYMGIGNYMVDEK